MFWAKAAYAAEAGGMEGPQILFDIFGLAVTSETTTMWGIMVVLAIVCYLATRNMKRIPSGLQNFIEYAVESIIKLLAGIMGEERLRSICLY